MIPKVIHYCWFGGNPLPENIQNYIRTWHDKCPDYEIKRWDESNFDITCIDYVKEAYECKKWAFVSDYARLWIIYNYGGIYLDTDIELVSDFGKLLHYGAFYGFEGNEYVNTGLGFGSVKNHPILADMMMVYELTHFLIEGKMNTLSCPHINTDILVQYGLKRNGRTQKLGRCIVLSSEYLCPYNYISKELQITNRSISIHHYSATWMNQDEKKEFEELNEYIHRYGELVGKLRYYIKKIGLNGVLEILLSRARKWKINDKSLNR